MQVKQTNHRKPGRTLYGVLFATALVMGACGGGGGGTAETVSLSGSVYAGPAETSSVLLRELAGAVVAGPVTTSADGSFSMEVPGTAFAQDLVFEASGGTFTDEAIGTTAAAGRLAAFAQGSTLHNGSAVHLTAGSTVVANLVDHQGKSRYAAEHSFALAFGYIPDPRVEPVNISTADDASRLSALRAGAFSHLTTSLGLTPDLQFDLLETLGTDLAEDIQNRFEHALLAYLDNGSNLTGLQPDGIGLLPFAKVALTDTYRVQYLPLDPGASLGRTPFTLQVTKRSTGDPVTGLNVAIQPVMHMASQEHSTAVDDITDNGDGTYDGAVYYLMAGGDGLGYWRLNITLDDGDAVQSLDLFPTIGSPNLAYLRGQEDLVEGLGDGQKRVYYLIDDGLSVQNLAEGTYRFGLFVATLEDEWNYPALATGLELHDENGSTWTVSAVTVEFSLDAANWSAMTDEGGGHLTISGITGLDPYASELALYVRLNVNGEQRTTDGAPEAGANGYAALVTGGASCCF